MIFAAPRFVVVDDKAEHLNAIVNVFRELGTPCAGVQYVAERELDAKLFAGVRVLFMDLHLVEGVATTDDNRHYAAIASLLEALISQNGGPYVLVIWTEHPQHVSELTRYLDKALPTDKPHVFPLAILALAKTKFINSTTGATKNADALRSEVLAAIDSNPQLAALLTWEADVLRAAGETLAALQSLVPASSRTSSAFPGALNNILSLLAREAVGMQNAKEDARGAVNGVLVPILADRILNASTGSDVQKLWNAAVTRADDVRLPDATPEVAASINRMLHLALPGTEAIRADTWGAVVSFPDRWGDMTLFFDASRSDMLAKEFRVKADRIKDCRARLIRVGAVCDHAQKRRGPVPYVLGFEIPIDARSGGKSTDAEWRSPVLSLTGGTPFVLVANARFTLNLTRLSRIGLTVSYRLREQLLMQLITHASVYVGRPGIIQMPTR